MKSDTIKRVLVLLIVGASFLAAFHHHNDTDIHHDCPVYVLQSNLTALDLPVLALLDEIEILYSLIVSIQKQCYADLFYRNYSSRAPPYYS